MCQTAICPFCQKISWTGCGEHVAKVMETHQKSDWCTCEHVFDDEDKKYPPKAGLGKPTPKKWIDCCFRNLVSCDCLIYSSDLEYTNATMSYELCVMRNVMIVLEWETIFHHFKLLFLSVFLQIPSLLQSNSIYLFYKLCLFEGIQQIQYTSIT